jgi:hypothetical protein
MPTVRLVEVPNFRMTIAGKVVSIQRDQTVTMTAAEWAVLTAAQQGYFQVVDKSDLADVIDRSGVIAVAATAQQIMPANNVRQFFFFQNVSDTDMWINFDVAAAPNQPSILIPPGGDLMLDRWCTRKFASVYCLYAAKPFTAKEA